MTSCAFCTKDGEPPQYREYPRGYNGVGISLSRDASQMTLREGHNKHYFGDILKIHKKHVDFLGVKRGKTHRMRYPPNIPKHCLDI